MTPASFGLPLFLRICPKNGVTDALLTCVILLRHTRHGALVNKGEAMTEWLTRRGRVSASNQVNWRSAEVVNQSQSRERYFGVELPAASIGQIGTLAESSTPPPPPLNLNPRAALKPRLRGTQTLSSCNLQSKPHAVHLGL